MLNVHLDLKKVNSFAHVTNIMPISRLKKSAGFL